MFCSFSPIQCSILTVLIWRVALSYWKTVWNGSLVTDKLLYNYTYGVFAVQIIGRGYKRCWRALSLDGFPEKWDKLTSLWWHPHSSTFCSHCCPLCGWNGSKSSCISWNKQCPWWFWDNWSEGMSIAFFATIGIWECQHTLVPITPHVSIEELSLNHE